VKEVGYILAVAACVGLISAGGCSKDENNGPVCSCAGKECGSDGCGGTCPPGCTAPEICNSAGICVAGGNLPCDGCAGDTCATNGDCFGGLICVRLNTTVAFCTNCPPVVGDCGPAGFCTADVNCGEGGVCLDYLCYHGCASASDCPAGYECYGNMACIPDSLPGLDQECAMATTGWCEPSLTESRTCLYYGTDFVTDPGENYCTRVCTDDSDCQDTWPLGCCTLMGSVSVCERRAHCG